MEQKQLDTYLDKRAGNHFEAEMSIIILQMKWVQQGPNKMIF